MKSKSSNLTIMDQLDKINKSKVKSLKLQIMKAIGFNQSIAKIRMILSIKMKNKTKKINKAMKFRSYEVQSTHFNINNYYLFIYLFLYPLIIK